MSSNLDVQEIRRCPGCGSAESGQVALGDRSLRQCRGCSLVYAPERADPSEVYAEGYLWGETDFGLNVMHPMFQDFLAHAAAIRMHLIERYAGPPGSLLDVGCGTGEVIAVARDRGWKVTGAEPVERSAQFALDERGLDVRAALLEESGLAERSFDVVTAFHVVEHMTDATGFIRTMARWARPGGHVVVEVPNWHSFHRRNAGSGWSGLRPLEHIGHYGPATLKATLQRAGLQPVAVRTPGFLWGQQTLDQMLDDLGLYRWKGRAGRLGRPGQQLGEFAVMPRPATALALRGLQAVYDRAGVGQVVFAVARVP